MDLKALRGFTLIELVVTVAIALIITGGIIVNYSSYNAIQVLKQAALTIKNDLRFIQGKAANGEKPTVGCVTLTGWNITLSSSSYSYQALCDDILTGTKTDVVLATGIQISPLPVPATFHFKAVTRGTNLAIPVDIVLTGSGRQYTIQISPSGDISDLGID